MRDFYLPFAQTGVNERNLMDFLMECVLIHRTQKLSPGTFVIWEPYLIPVRFAKNVVWVLRKGKLHFQNGKKTQRFRKMSKKP